jgi:hypothetical protein
MRIKFYNTLKIQFVERDSMQKSFFRSGLTRLARMDWRSFRPSRPLTVAACLEGAHENKRFFAGWPLPRVRFCSRGLLTAIFREIAEGTDPGNRLAPDHGPVLSSRRELQAKATMETKVRLEPFVQYSVVSLWANAIECARLTADKARRRSCALFDDFLPGRLEPVLLRAVPRGRFDLRRIAL